jgi:biotin transport system substrate-specific component
MILTRPLIPSLIEGSSRQALASFITITLGAAIISVLAQISVQLPFTPVPITGQTFGVALISLLMGWRLGLMTVFTYLIVGAMGAPVFAGATSGLSLSPSSGYLLGMLASAGIMGYLADRGWGQNLWTAYLACLMGSIVVFSFGCLVLSFFVPNENIFVIGVLPFLPGDLMKSVVASVTVSSLSRG